MTINERVSPKRLAEIIARAEVCDDSVLTDYRDIESIARELQQYRVAAEPVYQYQAFTFVENSDGEQEKFWFWSDCNERFYTACKGTKRILYAAPQVTSVPETLPCPVILEPGIKFGKGVRTQTMLDALQRRATYYAELESMTPEQLAEHDSDIKEFAAMLAAPAVQAEQNDELPYDPQIAEYEKIMQQAIPDGYALVPVEPTKEMMLHKSGCQRHAWDDADCPMRQTRRLVWSRMIEAVPKQEAQEVKK